MRLAKVAIGIDEETLERLDRLVADKVFPSRSQVVQEAIEEKLMRLARTRLAEECAKLDPTAEQALADERLSEVVRESAE